MQATIEGFRVSSQQQHLWLLRREGTDCRVDGAALLTGVVHDEALREALRELVASNEVLRTTFQTLPGVEVPLQVIGEAAAPALREARAAGGGGAGEGGAREAAAARLR